MDISIIETNCLKIRGKHSSLVVDPIATKAKAKTAADAIVLLKEDDTADYKNVENYRVVVDQAGEYEINGVMISGKKTDSGIVYKLIIDNINVVLGKASEVAKVLGKVDSCEMLILNVDSEVSSSTIGSLEPKVVVLYGEKRIDAAKNLNKEKTQSVQKFTLTKDKLLEGMEVVVLE